MNDALESHVASEEHGDAITVTDAVEPQPEAVASMAAEGTEAQPDPPDGVAAGPDRPDAVAPEPDSTDGVSADRVDGVDERDLLDKLAAAMLAAAEQERERIVATATERATAHITAIHARAATEGDDLRREAKDDQKRIDDWSSSEIARIRAEARRRGDDRRRELEERLREHDASVEAEIGRVGEAIAAYEARLDVFFTELRESTDAEHIAQRASTLPRLPDLEVLAHANTESEHVAATPETSDGDPGERGVVESLNEQRSDVVAAEPAPDPTAATPTVDEVKVEAETARGTDANASPEQADDRPVDVAVAPAEPRQHRGRLGLFRTIVPWASDDDQDTSAAGTGSIDQRH